MTILPPYPQRDPTRKNENFHLDNKVNLIEKVYLFKFCFSVSEGGWLTVSVHKTKKGAQTAMEFHKKEALSDPDYNMQYYDCDWCVCEQKLEE